jgi:hypothetical protein
VRHVDGSCVDDAVESHHLVVSTLGPAFRARAVIADDVNEQCIVGHAHVLKGVHEAAHLFVGVLTEAGKGFHLTGCELLLVWRLRVPRRNLLGPLGQICVRRNAPHLFLARKGLFLQHVPSLIEFALVAINVFLGYVMRSVQRTGCEVHEERFVRG